MKTISTFKKAINFYFYLLILIFFVLAFVIPIQYANDTDTPINFIEDFDFSGLRVDIFSINLLGFLVLFFLYIRAVYLIKNCLNDLSNGDYFSKKVTLNFKKAGKLFIISGIGVLVFKFVLRLTFVGDIWLGIDHAFMLSLVLGLFLMFLSEVFTKARKTQEENDLTI